MAFLRRVQEKKKTRGTRLAENIATAEPIKPSKIWLLSTGMPVDPTIPRRTLSSAAAEIESAQALRIGGSRPRGASVRPPTVDGGVYAGPSVPRNAWRVPRLGRRRGPGSAPPMSSRTGCQRGGVTNSLRPEPPGDHLTGGPRTGSPAMVLLAPPPAARHAPVASHAGSFRRPQQRPFPPPRRLSPSYSTDSANPADTLPSSPPHTPTPAVFPALLDFFFCFSISSSLTPTTTSPWPSCLPCPSGPPA